MILKQNGLIIKIKRQRKHIPKGVLIYLEIMMVIKLVHSAIPKFY